MDPAMSEFLHPHLNPGLAKPPQYPDIRWTDGQNHLMALANSLMTSDASHGSPRVSASDSSNDMFGNEPFQNASGTFGLPLTNLARMSADTALGARGSYFSHQIGRPSADGALVNSYTPAFQFSGLNRHSAGSMLPVGNNLAHRNAQNNNYGEPNPSLVDSMARLQDSQAVTQQYPRSEATAHVAIPAVAYVASSSHRAADSTNSAPAQSPASIQPTGGIYGLSSEAVPFPSTRATYPFPYQHNVADMASPPADIPLKAIGSNSASLTSADGLRVSNSNDLDGDPPFESLGLMDGAGGVGDVNKQRERNRNAQKRFRQRQKERMKDSQEQLQLITQQMNQLMQEKAELETRNKILEQVVRLSVEHVDQLQLNKQVLEIEQSMLMETYTEFVSKVEQKPKVSADRAREWLMGQVLFKYFQVYIDRLKFLHNEATRDPESPAHEELRNLVVMRREHEKQGALFSCFYWAVNSWNIHETKKRQDDVPDASHWRSIMVGLKLTKEQETELLTARRRMLTRLLGLVDHRKAIISRIGMQMLQTGKEGLASSPVAEELWQSLEAEREAVLNFLFFTLDEALTPAQEAYLDINSYPWHPDIWAIVECLAERRKDPRIPLPDLNFATACNCPIMPHSTAFEILTTPLTAIGIGVRLKRGILMCLQQSVAPKAALPILTQKQLENRTMLAIQCGKWKKYHFPEWQAQCLREGRLVSNEVTPEDEGYISP